MSELKTNVAGDIEAEEISGGTQRAATQDPI